MWNNTLWSLTQMSPSVVVFVSLVSIIVVFVICCLCCYCSCCLRSLASLSNVSWWCRPTGKTSQTWRKTPNSCWHTLKHWLPPDFCMVCQNWPGKSAEDAPRQILTQCRSADHMDVDQWALSETEYRVVCVPSYCTYQPHWWLTK